MDRAEPEQPCEPAARDGGDGTPIAALLARIRACRLCRDEPAGVRLPHQPRPLLQASDAARILIVGQAPGVRAHERHCSFDDPSGERLRAWMGIGRATFYDPRHIAIAAMGFCFPGQDARGADLPPRRECAPLWRSRLIALMPQLEMLLLVGLHAQRWHMPQARETSLGAIIDAWQPPADDAEPPLFLPLPHPSWRNNAWLKAHPRFERELLPFLRGRIRRILNV